MDTQPPVLDPSLVAYSIYKEDSETLEKMIKMIEKELSEPYSIFTYRYFLQKWPELSILAHYKEELIGVTLGKLENHGFRNRGYLAMIVVSKEYRKLKIGRKMVEMFIETVEKGKGDEVVLETECCNYAALALYESLGFTKDKRLLNYYMNGNDAFRLKLWLTSEQSIQKKIEEIQKKHEKALQGDKDINENKEKKEKNNEENIEKNEKGTEGVEEKIENKVNENN